MTSQGFTPRPHVFRIQTDHKNLGFHGGQFLELFGEILVGRLQSVDLLAQVLFARVRGRQIVLQALDFDPHFRRAERLAWFARGLIHQFQSKFVFQNRMEDDNFLPTQEIDTAKIEPRLQGSIKH